MNLKLERRKLKMTQKQFAALINYTQNYYSNLEQGYYPISERTKKIIKLAIDNYRKSV